MNFFTVLKKKISAAVIAKVTVGAVIVALLGGGTVGIAFAGGLTGPKTEVGVSVLNTFVSGNQDLFKDVREQGGEFSMEVSTKELSLDVFGLGNDMSFSDATFRLKAKASPEKEMSAALDFLVSGNKLLTANAYVNGEQWQVAVPKLFRAVLTGRHYAEDTVKDFLEGEQSRNLFTKVFAAYEEYLADTDIKKGQKEDLRISGKRYNCRMYHADLSAKNVNGFLQELLQGPDASGVKQEILPEFKDEIKVTFYICKERVVCLKAQWTTETESGSLILIPSANGEFSMHITTDNRTWNVKGSLTAAKNEIEPLAGSQVDALNMTAEEEAVLKAEISRNITRMLFQWLGLMK